MERIIKLNKERRQTLFETTARSMKISSVVVEKDFWVCVVLDYLMNKSQYKDYFIFKGGTSLSKCYDVIKRFKKSINFEKCVYLIIGLFYIGFFILLCNYIVKVYGTDAYVFSDYYINVVIPFNRDGFNSTTRKSDRKQPENIEKEIIELLKSNGKTLRRSFKSFEYD